MDDCLREAVDTDALIGVLERIERGEVRLHARDTVTPSAMAQILERVVSPTPLVSPSLYNTEVYVTPE